MKVRGIDANGDFTFGQGLSDYKTDQEAVKQQIKTRLLEWVGDCFFAADAGIDWATRLNPNQQNLLEQDIKSIILKTVGVVELITLSIVFTQRVLETSYVIRTIYSPSVKRLIEETVILGA